MRATLRDPALASYAGQFVWLELNYDNPKNAAFLDSHMNQGYPLLVIESPKGEVKMAWNGGATVAQMRVFLDEALAKPSPGKADESLRRGDAAFGKNEIDGAIAAYRDALKLGGDDWPRHDHAVEQLIGALQVKDNKLCAEAVFERAPPMPREHSFVNVALMGESCASAAAPEMQPKLEALATEALDLPAASEDDRYMLFEALYAARSAAKDSAGARALAEKYLAFVTSRSPPLNDDQRLARVLARLRAALKLGAPERAIPELEATERAIPMDDNASQWLAVAYSAANRPDDAIYEFSVGRSKPHSDLIVPPHKSQDVCFEGRFMDYSAVQCGALTVGATVDTAHFE